MEENRLYEKELLKKVKDIENGLNYYIERNKELEIENEVYKEMYTNRVKEYLEIYSTNRNIIKENKKLKEELNTENNRCMIFAANSKFKEQVIDLMADTFFKKFKAILLEQGFENEEQLKEYFIEAVKVVN